MFLGLYRSGSLWVLLPKVNTCYVAAFFVAVAVADDLYHIHTICGGDEALSSGLGFCSGLTVHTDVHNWSKVVLEIGLEN